MTAEQIVVLYSKFSPSCKRILDAQGALSRFVTLVCVDNARFRDRVARKYKVSSVPSVLLFRANDEAEVFEGPSISDWLFDHVQEQMELLRKALPDLSPPPALPDLSPPPAPRDTRDISVEEMRAARPQMESSSPAIPESEHPVPPEKYSGMSVGEMAKAMAKERDTAIPSGPPGPN